MSKETKTHSANSVQACQNCKNDFTIEPEDFDFYKKINVPAPTFCPECRLIRRMMFQNERTFYKRKCDLCHEEKLLIFPEENERPVYCSNCWWSDKWDPKDYEMEYDPSRPFLSQFKELLYKVPMLGLNNIEKTMVNSEYVNICSYLKNCYLLFNSDYNENCMYSSYLERSKDCSDLVMSDLCELCYMGHGLYKCFKTFYSTSCNDCVDVWFSENLIGCSNCFGCINLRNKQYCIYNKQYSKEEYFDFLAKINLKSRDSIKKIAQDTIKLFESHPYKYMTGLKNTDVSGDYIYNSKNVFNSFEVTESQDCKYCQFLIIATTKDSYDYTMWGGNAERMYECMGAGNNSQDVKFTFESWAPNFNLEYCWSIFLSSNNLFGCVALKNAEYCILNKQYKKEEFEKLRVQIIEDMNNNPYISKKGHVYKYGEFFPPEFSSHGYNETIVQKYFPLTKEKIIEFGYNWKDPETRNYEFSIKSSDLLDSADELNTECVNKIIECSHKGLCNDQCTKGFIITKSEYELYKRLELPLPAECHNCRYFYLKNKRNNIKFYDRGCMCEIKNHEHVGRCETTFKTSYSPESTKILYCEKCYQQEVS
jgi:hypothetical protein